MVSAPAFDDKQKKLKKFQAFWDKYYCHQCEGSKQTDVYLLKLYGAFLLYCTSLLYKLFSIHRLINTCPRNSLLFYLFFGSPPT